jgi:hypothetical protein
MTNPYSISAGTGAVSYARYLYHVTGRQLAFVRPLRGHPVINVYPGFISGTDRTVIHVKYGGRAEGIWKDDCTVIFPHSSPGASKPCPSCPISVVRPPSVTPRRTAGYSKAQSGQHEWLSQFEMASQLPP